MQTQNRIVVVENTPQLHKTLAEALDSKQPPISRSTSAKQCLDTLHDAIYIVDLMLEDMDGLSLIEDIRLKKPSLPIIAFIASQPGEQLDIEEQSLRKMVENSGANALFIAPFNLGQIVSTIDRFAQPLKQEEVA